jgi:uncharacterized protein YbjT (DUF2867 family)
MRTALIAGATGAIGTKLVKLLNESDQYSEIHCIGRRKPTISSNKIKVHVINYDDIAKFSLPESIDDVFCTLGTTIKNAGSVENFKKVDRDYVYLIGQLAQSYKAKIFSVISSVDADQLSLNYYNQTKGEAEESLKSLNLDSLRIFRPSILHGSRDELRFKEIIGYWLLTLLTPVLQGHWKKYRTIHIDQVAKAMYESALLEYSPVKVFESNEIQGF